MAELAGMLPFAQVDVPGRLALSEGRYLVRPALEASADPDVLVLRCLGAERSRARLRRGRPVAVPREPGTPPLPLSRITLIKAAPFADERAAEAWLRQVGRDEELARALLEEMFRTLNRALLAYRVSAPDGYAGDLHPGGAVTVRFGYGTGQEVSEGRWSAAQELPEHRRRSLRAELIDAVGAQERVAAVLGGNDRIAPQESLLVDAERAAALGRPELAALTLNAALEALRGGGGDPGEAAEPARRLHERALSGAEIDTRTLEQTLRLARRAIRAG